MKAVAVIGMNFGDEGKGHIVNFLSDENTLNIRFNGGAQAAHAVFLSDGRNHIFKQFGSGTLRGARTLLGGHFIVNPIFFVAEYAALTGKTALREVFIDPRCRVSTQYDMLINEFSCKQKGKNDTTGMGINETVERSQFRQLRISMRDLIDKNEASILSILEKIRIEYVPWRLDQIGIPYATFENYCAKMIKNLKELDHIYLKTVKTMLKHIVVWPDDDLIDRYLAKDKKRKVIFEGGQGLLLDQHKKEFMPYLTRSSTGLQNVFDCLRTVKTSLDLDVYLVTRAYLTRHGDGPLWNENSLTYSDTDDITNSENAYQGKMRYGFLDKNWYDKAIEETKKYVDKRLPKSISKVNIQTAFTCLDQLDGSKLIYSENGSKEFIEGSIDDFADVGIISKGRTEKDVCFL